ncbi:MAG: hypothetical protein ACRCXZ_09040 [Patescibacteria group bacterium]
MSFMTGVVNIIAKSQTIGQILFTNFVYILTYLPSLPIGVKDVK